MGTLDEESPTNLYFNTWQSNYLYFYIIVMTFMPIIPALGGCTFSGKQCVYSNRKVKVLQQENLASVSVWVRVSVHILGPFMGNPTGGCLDLGSK